jgi:hypothetical protein
MPSTDAAPPLQTRPPRDRGPEAEDPQPDVRRLESPDCPVRFLERYKAVLTYAGYAPSDYVGATAPDHESLNLQQALKMIVNAYDLPHLEDLTDHSIRVGAASAANAAHVPVRLIMQRMFHKAESSTFGYIRLHVRPTLGGTVFFGRESR